MGRGAKKTKGGDRGPKQHKGGWKCSTTNRLLS